MEIRCFDCNTTDWMKKFHWERNRCFCDQCYQKRIQPDSSKREDSLICDEARNEMKMFLEGTFNERIAYCHEQRIEEMRYSDPLSN